MSLVRLALCLTLLTSSLGFAQAPEEWTPYTPPATQGEPPPPLISAPPPPPPTVSPPAPGPEVSPPPQASPQAEVIPRSVGPEEDQTGLRLVVTPWAGVGLGLVGAIAGLVPSAIVALPFCLREIESKSDGCAIALGTGVALSYSLGTALGVTLAGDRLGGHGSGMATLFGALAGAALGGGLSLSTRSAPVIFWSLSLGPLLGAVLGYEASHNMYQPEVKPAMQAHSGFQVVPVLGATGRGGILGGLAGRF